eukprot:TRINITY_DN5087_c0_g1_i1.p1 TRINITY_DN5087_c0_g1~~TRINITY_DN5087_c0_g1_i1.p1  ORF type:complete len:798 (+),score=128.98 TRINITY_DN5087_c0_g1_i1:341-2734(+)
MIPSKKNFQLGMCGGPVHSKPNVICEANANSDFESHAKGHEKQSFKLKEIGSVCSILLELAAGNDVIGFKQSLQENILKIDEASYWYGRKYGANGMTLEQRTPIMIAALFGSVDVLSYILATYSALGLDINRKCGSDNSTALHCAAAGGSDCAIEVIKLLLQAGADINSLDILGRRPADVIVVSPKLYHARPVLEDILNVSLGARWNTAVKGSTQVSNSTLCLPDFLHEDVAMSQHSSVNRSCSVSPTSSPPLSSSPITSCTSSPSLSPQPIELPKGNCENNEKKEYPVDPSLPDIKNSIYTTDEFRMYSFKVRPCSRAYSHDWTECPFVHPGENARRRDPRRFHYSCVPCPEFRKGSCRRGDSCEYAHGVFESWLHPAQYRTRLCKDGTNCARRVCFFAHKPEELRPLYVSTGSAVPSPRISTSMDMSSTVSPLAPGSPSSVLMMSPFSPSNPSQNSLFTPPMSPSSPSANKGCHSSLMGGWSQSSLPSLHLPGAGNQTSRLRSALSARDIPLDDLSLENDSQMINEFSPLTNQARMNSALAASSVEGNSSGKYKGFGVTGIASNLDDLFASEMSMSGMADFDPSLLSHVASPFQANKAMHNHSQLPSQKQLSINTQVLPTTAQTVDPQSPGRSFLQSSMLSPSYSLSSLSRMSSFSGDIQCHKSGDPGLSPVMSPKISSRLSVFSQHDRRSHSSRDLGAHVLPTTCADWSSPTGKLDWGVNGEELNKFRKSASFGYHGSSEPASSWIHSLGKEVPDDESIGNIDYPVEANGHVESTDSGVVASWMDELHLDQMVV